MTEANSIPSVLLALNEDPTLTVISYHLERYGFVVNSAKNTEAALTAAERIEPNILIIDEDIAGTLKTSDVCTILKTKMKTKNIHIILLSKKPQTDNYFINDSIVKPFVPSELVGKIKIFASNNMATKVKMQKTLSFHDIEMNVNAFKVTRGSKSIHLGPTEFKILQCFLELPSRILSREHIMNHVWGYNSQVEPRTIDVHINRLRTALKDNESEVPLIRTIRSAGYCLSSPKTKVSS